MATAEWPAATLKLLLDEMLDPEIAVQLRRRGYDVVAVVERVDLRSELDPEIFAAARLEGRCVVTENARDFRPLLAGVLPAGESHPGIILTTDHQFPRNNPRTIGRMVTALEALLVRDTDLTNQELWLS